MWIIKSLLNQKISLNLISSLSHMFFINFRLGLSLFCLTFIILIEIWFFTWVKYIHVNLRYCILFNLFFAIQSRIWVLCVIHIHVNLRYCVLLNLFFVVLSRIWVFCVKHIHINLRYWILLNLFSVVQSRILVFCVKHIHVNLRYWILVNLFFR